MYNIKTTMKKLLHKVLEISIKKRRTSFNVFHGMAGRLQLVHFSLCLCERFENNQ